MILTEEDIQVTGLGDGWYVSIQRGIETKEQANSIKKQILEIQEKAVRCDGTCHPYKMRPAYHVIEKENQELKEIIEKIKVWRTSKYYSQWWKDKKLKELLTTKKE